jgi:hypothetical protein
MPPEQAGGRHGDIGPASDVYSLGAMLYELLTGRPPFRGNTAMATILEVLEAEPVALRSIKADIPPDLETISLKCLEKSPTARYPTARALAEELDRFIKGEPIQAKPASLLRKTVSWTRRHPGTLAAIAAFVIFTLSFGVLYLIEENAFLRAKLADPAIKRLPAERSDSLMLWGSISIIIMAICILVSVAINRRNARSVSIEKGVDPRLQNRQIKLLSGRMRALILCVGLLLLGSSLALMAMSIQAHVWEGVPLLVFFSPIYCSMYFGLMSFGFLIRDYRRANFGAASRQLTEEQIESIRRAIEDFDIRSAVNLYTKAVPDAERLEAVQFVTQYAKNLKKQKPEKFAPPTFSFATLNWTAMKRFAFIDACFIAFICLVTKLPPHPSWTIAQFVYSCLFGLGIVACSRVKSFGKLILILTPALLATALTEGFILSNPAYVGTKPNNPAYWILACALGFISGAFMMGCGFIRRRKRSA